VSTAHGNEKRELRRRQEQERSRARQRLPLDTAPAEDNSSGTARRAAATTCGWCHGPITPRSRGPITRWRSATGRHRAWEQSRAAASGRSAIHVVERVVTVPAVAREPARRPRQLDWWTFCKSSPLRSPAARSTTGIWAPLPRPSTTSSAPSYDDAAHPRARRRRGPGGDRGVTLGGSRPEGPFLLSPPSQRCH
jgi:hypothetical protein